MEMEISHLVEEITDTDLPRIDYTDGCGSWLLEPQSTNLITQSELFSDSSWVKNGFGSALAPVVTLNSDISPDSTENASRIEMDCTSTSSSDYSAIYQQLALDGSSEYTISFYIKSNTSSEQDLLFFSNSSFSTQITANSEWQRVESTFTSNSANTRNFGLVARGSVQQDVDILIWGAQLEQQSYATSYIPTNGATNTRLQDIANNSGNSTVINSTEGGLFAEIAALADDGTIRTIALNKDTNDRIQMYFDASTNGLSIFYKAQSGATAFVMNQTLTDTTLFNKIAFKWKTNDFSLWINGTKTDTVSSGVTSNADTLNSLDFKMFNNSNTFYGKAKTVAVYKEALTDAELQSLTTI